MNDMFCFSSRQLRGGLKKDKMEAHLVELPQSRWSTSVLGKKLDGCLPGICCCPHRKAGNNSRSLQQAKMNVQHINAIEGYKAISQARNSKMPHHLASEGFRRLPKLATPFDKDDRTELFLCGK